MRATVLLISAMLLVTPPIVIGKEQPRTPKRLPLTGTYEMMRGKRPSGTLLVKQLAPNKIEFELECNRGAPSYSSGWARHKVDIIDGVAVYRTIQFGAVCELKFEFKRTEVLVSEIGTGFECGFGNGVYCGGIYHLKSRKQPRFEQR